MTFENITVEIENFIATVSLNRPPANSVNLATIQDIDKALDELENNKTVRVLIITGSGEKGFSAGFDVSDFMNAEKAGIEGQRVWNRIFHFPKPVIAAINGFAFGGGCELAMACHFRIMVNTPKSKIGLTELNLGIIPGWGGTQRMTAIVGREKALDLILFSKRLTPEQALESGLVDKICDPSDLMKEVNELASKLAQRPPVAMGYVLRAVSSGIDRGFDEGLKIELEGCQAVSKTEDAKEGFTAFFEKRKPVFKGE